MHNVLLMLVSNTSIITRTFYYLKPGLAVNKKVGKDFFAHLLINRTPFLWPHYLKRYRIVMGNIVYEK